MIKVLHFQNKNIISRFIILWPQDIKLIEFLPLWQTLHTYGFKWSLVWTASIWIFILCLVPNILPQMVHGILLWTFFLCSLKWNPERNTLPHNSQVEASSTCFNFIWALNLANVENTWPHSSQICSVAFLSEQSFLWSFFSSKESKTFAHMPQRYPVID